MTQEIENRISRLRASSNLPAHVAIIMDGNGRWATKRRLPRLAGHRAGRESVRAVVRTAAKIGIPYLTLYAFSLENWQRPKSEVRGLMTFFKRVLKEELRELDGNGVQLRAIGRLDILPPDTGDALREAIDHLKNNTRLVLTLALSYGGRAEIIDAVRRISAEVAAGALSPEAVDDLVFSKFLYDPTLPDPDLLIRTSGEMRVSNFLLWQLAYTEIYVTTKLWPDFRAKDLIESIQDFQSRERRFGLIT
ncbi:MAG: isoprenyl transferase [Chitinivibrionia bacterium]|nr:isoprenyl transferase [Chitinivibrionia bacterium]